MIHKAYEGNDPYMFASYDREDIELVLPILAALQERGFRVWYYTYAALTADRQEEIAIYLDNCDVFVSFVTQRSLNSQAFRQELNFGIELNKERLIIYLEDVQLSLGMQMRLGFVQNMYYTRHSSMDSFLDELCRSQVLARCRDAEGHVTIYEAYRKGMMSYECGRHAEAVQWLQKAAEQGHAQAMHKLSRCYEKGHGVPRSITTAIQWLEKAAEQGHTQAQSELGAACLQGVGTAQSEEKAIFWYKKAAEKDDVDALCGLGIIYAKRQNAETAVEGVRYLQKAARLGSSYAQDVLRDIGLPW